MNLNMNNNNNNVHLNVIVILHLIIVIVILHLVISRLLNVTWDCYESQDYNYSVPKLQLNLSNLFSYNTTY